MAVQRALLTNPTEPKMAQEKLMAEQKENWIQLGS